MPDWLIPSGTQGSQALSHVRFGPVACLWVGSMIVEYLNAPVRSDPGFDLGLLSQCMPH